MYAIALDIEGFDLDSFTRFVTQNLPLIEPLDPTEVHPSRWSLPWLQDDGPILEAGSTGVRLLTRYGRDNFACQGTRALRWALQRYPHCSGSTIDDDWPAVPRSHTELLAWMERYGLEVHHLLARDEASPALSDALAGAWLSGIGVTQHGLGLELTFFEGTRHNRFVRLGVDDIDAVRFDDINALEDTATLLTRLLELSESATPLLAIDLEDDLSLTLRFASATELALVWPDNSTWDEPLWFVELSETRRERKPWLEAFKGRGVTRYP